MTSRRIPPIGPGGNRFQRYATHAAESESGDVRRKEEANPKESRSNLPDATGWQGWKACEAISGTHARDPISEPVRQAHGNIDSSAGPYRGKSEQAESSPPLGKHLRLILGPPGTGKTTRLLGLLGDVLQRGTGPEQVAFVSFTRAARAEARARVLEQLAVGEDDLPWFRTIHSAAYRLLGLGKIQVMGPAHWRSFCDRYRYKLTNPMASLDDDPSAMAARTEDDKLRYVLEWARNRWS